MNCDVIIIGAGVAGCCAARELTRYQVGQVVVLEAGNDIANGATRANSGIVHAGYDPQPGTLKAKYNVEGARLMGRWAGELGFGYWPNGAFVLAFCEEEAVLLHELAERGAANGVGELHVITGEEARRREPNLAPGVCAALDVPQSAICDPYGLTYGAAENAAENGVEFRFNERVICVEKLRAAEGTANEDAGGPAAEPRFRVTAETPQGERRSYLARAVVNAAGLFADEINNMVSARTIKIVPRRGEYCLYDTEYSELFLRTLFQAPTAAGKGVLVSRTIHGNLFVGPNAQEQASKTDRSTTAAGLEGVLASARKTWPGAGTRGIITNFAGLRASSSTGDFIVGEAPDVPGFFNIAGFDSPGLTAAPAAGTHIAAQVAARLNAEENPDFNPHRVPPRLFAMMDDEQRAALVSEDPAFGHVMCRCCKVTEGELVEAMHRPLPVMSLDALKWRTGATMGRCHGGFCSPEIVRLMARELGVRPEQIDKRLPGSHFAAQSREDYLEAAAGAGSEGAEGVPPASCDVLVVGGGAAGMAAAARARAAGAESVVLLDREADLGGVMRQCIHDGFGLQRFGQELTGPEFAERELVELDARGVQVFPGTSVLRIDAAPAPADGAAPGTHRVVAVNRAGEHFISARAVVLATGSRERGLGALNLAGSRPSGVFSAGSAQALMNLQGCLPGRRAVVLGSGDIGLIMARRMALSGMEVVGVHELCEFPSGLKRNIVQCLNDFAIPLYLSSTVVRLEGDHRLQAVWTAAVDPATRRPLPGTEQRVECDTLLLSVGLLPENEVAKSAGVQLDEVTGGPVVDDRLETNVPGIFSCGNALHVHDLADFAAEEGEVAGTGAAAHARKVAGACPAAASSPHSIPIVAGEGVRYVVPQRAVLSEPAERSIAIFFRVGATVRKPRFIVEAVAPDGSAREVSSRSAMVAVPAEMRQMRVDRSDIADSAELRVRVEGEAI